MTIDNSMDGKVFEVFLEKYLVPRWWSGAVVVIDNLPTHKLASIKHMIVVVAAFLLCYFPYFSKFNTIELWWSQLKFVLQQFSPTTTRMVDTIIAVALDLMNPTHP